MNDKVKEITDKIEYATIATVNPQGQPWNSPVWSLHDENYTYYWCSHKDGQHSKNIRSNNRVFIVIYDSTAPEGTGEGVYIQASVDEINDAGSINQILMKRKIAKPNSTERAANEFLNEYPRRWYRARPEHIWLNDEGEINGNYIDIRKQVV